MRVMRRPFLQGIIEGLPFVLVAGPFAVLFGVLATEAGLDLTQTMAFTTIVIAGASQLTALQMMEQGAPTLIVIASALAVNLRMVMYSAAIVPHLGPARLWQRAMLSYFLVDQTYALAAARFEERADWTLSDKLAFFAGSCVPIFPVWVGATWAGAVLGAQIPTSIPLDFAAPITFLALVGPMLKSPAHIAAAFVSTVGALALAWVPWNLGLLVAALAALAVGAEIERRQA